MFSANLQGVFFPSCTRQSRQWSCRKWTRLVLFNFGLLNLLSLPLPSGYFYGSKRKCSFYVLELCMGVTHLAILIRGRVSFILKSPPEFFGWKRKMVRLQEEAVCCTGRVLPFLAFLTLQNKKIKKKIPSMDCKESSFQGRPGWDILGLEG